MKPVERRGFPCRRLFRTCNGAELGHESVRNGGTINLINSDADNGAASHALHVQNISGQHTFVLNLNSDNHALSDMLYVQNVGETGKTGGKPQNLHIISNGKRGLT